MPFFVDYRELPEDQQTYSEWLRRVSSYREYLESIRTSLPAEAYAFANLQYCSDFNEHGYPHDMAVEDFELRTVYSGGIRFRTAKHREPYRVSRTRFLKRRWQRGYLSKRGRGKDLELFVRIPGEWLDGYIELTYKRVHAFLVWSPQLGQDSSPILSGTGWREHEVRLSERGLVLHEVRFDCGVFWRIECDDIIYKWVPFAKQDETK